MKTERFDQSLPPCRRFHFDMHDRGCSDCRIATTDARMRTDLQALTQGAKLRLAQAKLHLRVTELRLRKLRGTQPQDPPQPKA
jgi:hypothetical protein